MSTPPTAPPLSICVVVPMRDARQYLDTCLGSVVRATAKCGADLVVVDNGSQDGSPEIVRSTFGAAVRLLTCSSGGISAARNMGAAATDSDVVVFLDADCEVPDHFLAEVQALFSNPAVAAAGCKYALPKQARWLERAWHEIHFTAHDGPVNYLPGGNLSVRRSVLLAVSGFDEGMRTGEDADLCQRITRSGRAVFQSRRLVAVHHGNAKTLSGFYRKQRWHAVGMAATVRRGEIDKPFVASVLHAGCLVAASAMPWLFHARGGFVVAAMAILIGSLMPVLTVVWRLRYAERVTLASVLGATVLYHAYYLARLSALFRELVRSQSGTVRRA